MKGMLAFEIREHSPWASIAARKLRARKVAMVLGKTIHLHNTAKEEFLADRRWLRHELAHIAQFRKYGSLRFLMLYLWWSWRFGYQNNPFEIEAREAETLD